MQLKFKFDFDVTKAAILYLASKGLPDFDKYRAVTLIFLSDRQHLLRFGRPITGDTYSALPFGPAPNRILGLLNGVERTVLEGEAPSTDEVAELSRCIELTNIPQPTIRALVQPDLDCLAQTDLLVLDAVADEHGHEGFNHLKQFTHSLQTYCRSWRPGDLRKKFPIPFEAFFADDPDGADFLLELQQDQQLREALANAEESPLVKSA